MIFNHIQNKWLIPVVVIILFTLVASIKLFNFKFYTSHDGGGHVIRMIDFDESLHEGQFPVRIAKRINHGLGYPFFNFNYPLIYYLSSGLHILGFSFVVAFKLLMILAILIGGIFIYIWLRNNFGNMGALGAAIFYIFVPYRFLNLYVRGDVSEALALGLIPGLFWATDQTPEKIYRLNLPLVLILSLLILSHNITAMLGFGWLIVYISIKFPKINNKKKLLVNLILCVFVALLLTVFFWVPALLESPLTKLVELTEDYSNFFPTFQELIYSPWGFGSYKQGEFPGKMSVQIGLLHELVIVIGFVLLLIRRNKLLIFGLALCLISLFLVLPISKFFWNNILLLKFVQLPWRFVGYVVLGASIIAGYFIAQIKGRKSKLLVITLFILGLIYTNRNHIRVNQYIDFENPFLVKATYDSSTTSKDEHMPRLAPRIFTDPNLNGNIFPTQNGTSERLRWRSNYRQFKVVMTGAGQFRDNTSYFPGWIAKVNNVVEPINYIDDDFRRLRLKLNPGVYNVEFFFKETNYRLFFDYLSLGTFFGLCVYFLVLAWRKVNS